MLHTLTVILALIGIAAIAIVILAVWTADSNLGPFAQSRATFALVRIPDSSGALRDFREWDGPAVLPPKRSARSAFFFFARPRSHM
jgi:hypothetical protein